MSDKKTPQEASNIFHSIMKASVSKKATKNKENKDMIPIELLEEMHADLPDANNANTDFIKKQFSYAGKNYSISFYKVKDTGLYFWLFNPYNVFEII